MTDEGGTVEVNITPAVHVEIRHQDRKSEFVLAFMDWMSDAKVFPIRGTGSSSPVTRMGSKWFDGHWVGVFHAADYPALKAWLDAHTHVDWRAINEDQAKGGLPADLRDEDGNPLPLSGRSS